MGSNGMLLSLVKPNFPPVTKEDIRSGYRYLILNLSNLISYMLMFEELKNYVYYLLAEFERLLKIDGKRIEEFQIGKTYAILKKRNRSNWNNINGNNINSNLFRIAGISDKFRSYYKKQNYEFLIGFAIITRQNVPPNSLPYFNNQQALTLALESDLIKHFAYDQADNRCKNKSQNPGNKSQQYAGGVIYLAVKTCEDSRPIQYPPYPLGNHAQPYHLPMQRPF